MSTASPKMAVMKNTSTEIIAVTVVGVLAIPAGIVSSMQADSIFGAVTSFLFGYSCGVMGLFAISVPVVLLLSRLGLHQSSDTSTVSSPPNAIRSGFSEPAQPVEGWDSRNPTPRFRPEDEQFHQTS